MTTDRRKGERRSWLLTRSGRRRHATEPWAEDQRQGPSDRRLEWRRTWRTLPMGWSVFEEPLRIPSYQALEEMVDFARRWNR